MNNSDLNFNNIRHVSVRKKTASRICSAQVLYEETFLETNINLMNIAIAIAHIKYFKNMFLFYFLKFLYIIMKYITQIFKSFLSSFFLVLCAVVIITCLKNAFQLQKILYYQILFLLLVLVHE